MPQANSRCLNFLNLCHRILQGKCVCLILHTLVTTFSTMAWILRINKSCNCFATQQTYPNDHQTSWISNRENVPQHQPSFTTIWWDTVGSTRPSIRQIALESLPVHKLPVPWALHQFDGYKRHPKSTPMEGWFQILPSSSMSATQVTSNYCSLYYSSVL